MAYLVGFEDMEMGTNKKQKWMEEEVKKYKRVYDYLSWNPATGDIRIHVIMNVAPPKTYKNKKDFLSQFRKLLAQNFGAYGGALLTTSDKIWERMLLEKKLEE